MVNREVIYNELKDCIDINDTTIDLNDVVDNPIVKNGFYIYRIHDDAHFFINNTFIESCPGYFAIERGDVIGRGH